MSFRRHALNLKPIAVRRRKHKHIKKSGKNKKELLENVQKMQTLRHEIENYSWEVVQNIIEKEISAAFKLKEPPTPMPTKKELRNKSD